MDRRRALAFVVASLGIVAIALAAATLTTPVMSDEDWRGSGEFEEDPGDGGGDAIEALDRLPRRPLSQNRPPRRSTTRSRAGGRGV